VTLTVPGLPEPATGRLVSVPDGRAPLLNDLSFRQGRAPAPDRPDEVIVSETFAGANHLEVGSRIGAVLNGRRKDLTVVGLALSPEYVYDVSPAMVFPDNRRFGVMWMNRTALEGAFDMKGAFNDVALRLARGASEDDVSQALDRLLAPYGGLAAYGRSEQASDRFLADELGEIEVTATYIPAIFLAVSAFLLYMLLARLVASARPDRVAENLRPAMRASAITSIRALHRGARVRRRIGAGHLAGPRADRHLPGIFSLSGHALPPAAVGARLGRRHRTRGRAARLAAGGVARGAPAAGRGDAAGAAAQLSRRHWRRAAWRCRGRRRVIARATSRVGRGARPCRASA
jgi:hypothetical protein